MVNSYAQNLLRITYLELLFSFRIPASLIFVLFAPTIMLLVLFNRYEEPGFIVAGLLSWVTGFSTLQGVGQVVAGMRFGIWRTLRVALHPDWLYLVGVLLSRVLRTLLVVTALLFVAFLAFGYEVNGSLLQTLGLVFCGSIVFASLGLFLAYLPKSPLTASHLISALVLVMMIVSGIFFPVSGGLEAVSWASPMTFLTHLLRASVIGESLAVRDYALYAGVLSAWTLASAFFAYRLARKREDDLAV